MLLPNKILPKYVPLCLGVVNTYLFALHGLKKAKRIPKAAHKEIQYRCFTHFDKDGFLLDLIHSQPSQVYQYTDPGEALEFWYKTFSSVYNKHAPSLTKRVKYTRRPPWLSKEIEEAMHQRNRLLKARKHE